jgi:predicted house-cleaning NTP pyrophosphatase (Maf/HAM1 superfamily)
MILASQSPTRQRALDRLGLSDERIPTFLPDCP